MGGLGRVCRSWMVQMHHRCHSGAPLICQILWVVLATSSAHGMHHVIMQIRQRHQSWLSVVPLLFLLLELLLQVQLRLILPALVLRSPSSVSRAVPAKSSERVTWKSPGCGGVEELLSTWPTRSYLKTKEEEFVLGPPRVVPKLTPTFFLCR
jgi:hypothetical protein